MNSDTRYRKQIMFDLDTKVCEQILENFLKSNTFIVTVKPRMTPYPKYLHYRHLSSP